MYLRHISGVASSTDSGTPAAQSSLQGGGPRQIIACTYKPDVPKCGSLLGSPPPPSLGPYGLVTQ